jgi:hypothetical protein
VRRSHRGIQLANGDSSFRDDCHVVGFVGDDSRESRHRDAQCDRCLPNRCESTRCADGDQRDSIRFAHADDLANLSDRSGLDDGIRSACLRSDWLANATGTDERVQSVRKI